MTRSRLVREMDCDELAEWIAFCNVTGPLGEERADINAAIVAATIANCHSTKRTFSPRDFIIDYRPQKPAQTMEQMKHVGMLFTVARGGQIIHPSDPVTQ